MESPRQTQRRKRARLSTITAVTGALLVAVGVVLTVTRVGGNLLPTILAVAGVGAFLAGTVIGAQLVADNFRTHQSQSYYDDE